MLSTQLLLQNKIKAIPKYKRKEFLLECINKNISLKKNLSDSDILKILEKEQLKKDISISENFCKVSKTENLNKERYSEIFGKCGYVRNVISKQKQFEKIEYIKPRSNLVKIVKDSKTITVDLNKINNWLQDTDPYAKDTKKIIDNLDIIFQSKSIELPKNVQNTSVSLWYNFNSFYTNYNGSLKKLYNKKAILSLCVYYGGSIHGYNISLQQLSILFNVNVSDIITANTLFKELFKKTDYFKDLDLQEQKECDIKLSKKNLIILDKIKNDLKDFIQFKEPLENKEYVGIVYFITNKINTDIKYTLKQLEQKCNVSTTTISSISKSIENFYKNNTNKYKQLII